MGTKTMYTFTLVHDNESEKRIPKHGDENMFPVKLTDFSMIVKKESPNMGTKTWNVQRSP